MIRTFARRSRAGLRSQTGLLSQIGFVKTRPSDRSVPVRSFSVAPQVSTASSLPSSAAQMMGGGVGTPGNPPSTQSENPIWFPKTAKDLDLFSKRIFAFGAELDADHPGFHDPEYRSRRLKVAEIAQSYRHGQPIPQVEYTDKEHEAWRICFTKLDELRQYRCNAYNSVLPELGLRAERIPQLEEVSQKLNSKTGWLLRPTGGLLSPRDFLNGLAFRVFHSTQYIRHYSQPLYTPEPDVVHELLGHAPLLADKDFAQFSQEIGVASLGVSDEDITKLATVYWFSVEFGVCKEDGQIKAYGAGLLSSFGELEHSCALKKPQILPFDPFVVCKQQYPITTYQPILFCSESFVDSAVKVKQFSKSLKRGFDINFDLASRFITPTFRF